MKTIGKQIFDVPPPLGMASFALQQRVLPIAGRVVSVFLHLLGGENAGDLVDKDVTTVLPAAMPYLGQIFSEMPEGELERLTRDLLKDTTCDGVRLFGGKGGGDPFDALMRGRTMDTWQLLYHALEVWYPDFFGLAQNFLGSARAANASGGSNTSAGSGQAHA